MSKTDTVARFSLTFARKVHFLENSSVRENFCQKLAESSLFKIIVITTPRGVLGTGGALASAKFAHGVHAHGVQLALSRSALSQPCLRAPASALELVRRGHVVVQRLHAVKALHCRRRATLAASTTLL